MKNKEKQAKGLLLAESPQSTTLWLKEKQTHKTKSHFNYLKWLKLLCLFDASSEVCFLDILTKTINNNKR